jgi:S-formylglutathione hydrolase
MLERAINQGLLPPAVSVMPSAGRSFYMDFKDGSEKWEAFIIQDLLPYMRKNFDVAPGRKGTFITGISMGGMGSLRIAFKHPEMFQGVASQEPGIEPALTFDEIKLRDRFWRSDELFQQIYGKPVDKAYWAANNPATIASRAPDRLLGLGIYLEVGDQDMFYLDQGTEYLHRVLFDAGIGHEYRLVKGADHVGASLPPRVLDAFAFIGRQINPPHWIDDTALKTRARLDGQKRDMGYAVTPVDPNRIHAK